MSVVYLAGGYKLDWRDKVIERVPKGIKFLDPKKKERGSGAMSGVSEYVSWDLYAIRKADIVFAYIDRQNRSCLGASCEVGYAKALNKTIILVVEPSHNHIEDRYFDFLKECASVNFDDLHTATSYLRHYTNL